jgi:hypothetical protein
MHLKVHTCEARVPHNTAGYQSGTTGTHYRICIEGLQQWLTYCGATVSNVVKDFGAGKCDSLDGTVKHCPSRELGPIRSICGNLIQHSLSLGYDHLLHFCHKVACCQLDSLLRSNYE